MTYANHTKPMPPVVKQHGFKYWKIGTRYAGAIMVNGNRLYADNYPVSQEPTPDDFTEPDDFEFIRLMNGQEK